VVGSGVPRAAEGVAPAERGQVRLQSRGLRWLLIVSGVLVLLAGVQLFVFTERTDEYFAWTIVPSVSAAFLGAGYFAAVAMEWLAVRERVWVSARLVSVTILVFATLTTVATFAHLDRFHFDGPTVGTIAVTWVWMVIYVTVPVLMVGCLVVQRRMPGADPPRVAPVPTWFKAVFGFHAVVMLVVGAPMFAFPVATGNAVWPWDLTPLTGRAIAAWLLGMGFAGLVGMWEDDWVRLRPMAVSFALLVGFQLVALARYATTLDWGQARTWLYLVYLVDMLVLALIAYRETRRAAYGRSPQAGGRGGSVASVA
jgi:hypothetical protein